MNNMELIKYSIPLLFVVGIIGFFILIPYNNYIFDFVVYMSSLSTVIMVLVYLFSTSQQLDTMRLQLDEMKFTRKSQHQPLLSFSKCNYDLDLPKFYVGPDSKFKIMQLITRLFFRTSVMNIGNGPSISITFIPKLLSINKNVLVESIGDTIECLSLKEGDSEQMSFLFLDYENILLNELLINHSIIMDVTIVYKNSLGLSFKQKMQFMIMVNSKDEMELIKSGVKLIKTADIDYTKRIKQFNVYKEKDKDKEAEIIFDEINKELDTYYSVKSIKNNSTILPGSFTIITITDEEYNQEYLKYQKSIEKIIFSLAT
jgi:hypothetical protein